MMGFFVATAAVIIYSTSFDTNATYYEHGVYTDRGTRSSHDAITDFREALDDVTPRAVPSSRGRIQAPPELRIGELDDGTPILEERRLRWLRGRITAPREKKPRRRRIRVWERDAAS